MLSAIDDLLENYEKDLENARQGKCQKISWCTDFKEAFLEAYNERYKAELEKIVSVTTDSLAELADLLAEAKRQGASAAEAARMLVIFLARHTFTSMSLSRQCSPTIWPLNDPANVSTPTMNIPPASAS